MINKSEESTRTTAAGQIEWDSKIASLDIKGNHRQAFPLTISQAEWHTFVGFCADSVHTLLTVFPKTIFAPIKRQQFSTQMQKTEKMQKGGGDTKKVLRQTELTFHCQRSRLSLWLSRNCQYTGKTMGIY